MEDRVTRQLAEWATKNADIVAMWLYGSRARGNQQPASDYDLAVRFTAPTSDPLTRSLRPQQLASQWLAALPQAH